MGELFKIYKNKKNNQLYISLSRKKLQLMKDSDPISMEIDKIKFKFDEYKRKRGL
jgi:nitroimidazol reductase NimA-like FMN-containing flavoprotein (pyridoxamine 5'-phosphate oxidase superfamily)